MERREGASRGEESTVLSALIQAFSALSIFVFYFGWVWEDAYLQMFGLRASALDLPFYYFLIQGLKVNFPYQIEEQLFTRWQVLAWAINLVLVVCALIGNTSKKFKMLVVRAPSWTLLGITFLLVFLFLGMHYVGSRAGHERAQLVMKFPGLLRSVTYEYSTVPNAKAQRFSAYLLMLTKDKLYVLQPINLQDRGFSSGPRTPLGATILSLDHLAYIRTGGYQ